ncbi:MAG: 50S ribosomal protein L3 [Candidatus Tectimicrobiota bacterium]
MLQGLIGCKIGMTQLFSDDGDVLPVTAIEVGPCWVVQKKTAERDGYTALQLGFGKKKTKNLSKPLRGHFARSGATPTRWLREFRVDAEDLPAYQEGQQVSGELLEGHRYVDVTGTSKGRGFTGVIKRHNFAGKSMSHGTHEYFRHGGSIGASADPARVWKNKGMPGQYGNTRVTVQNLEIVRFLKDQNILLVRGAVPGPNGGMVLVSVSKKKP